MLNMDDRTLFKAEKLLGMNFSSRIKILLSAEVSSTLGRQTLRRNSSSLSRIQLSVKVKTIRGLPKRASSTSLIRPRKIQVAHLSHLKEL